MKLQSTLKQTFFTLLFVIIAASVFAQTGKISGTVTDKKTGETLIGVSVKIAGTTKAVGTDVDGKYLIGGLATGKYTLEVSYVGYPVKNVTDIEVTDKSTTSLNVILEELGTTLNQVTITASFKQETTNALYAQQKNSAVISDGISSDQIKKSPDKNTSDVLKRVSGATIQDNKFVIIRGLSDRYNTATLDNSTLPSTEANKKALSFDIVPSNLVDKITISKTATPDLPADFAGGAVQIVTRDIPDQNFVSIGVGYGFNSQSTFRNLTSTRQNALSYLGFEDGSKQLAENFPSTEMIAAGTLSNSKNIAALKSLPNSNSVSNSSALPNQNYQLSVGRVKNFENGNKFGAFISGTYRNSQTINEDVERKFYVYDYSDNQNRLSTNVGGLANFAYSFGKNKITLKNIYNRNYDNTYAERTGIKDANSLNQFFAYDIMQKSLFKTTLEGDHQIGAGNSKLKWTASYGNIGNNQPNQLKINYTKPLNAQNDPTVLYQANITSLGKDNTRLFSDLNEDIFAGDINFNRSFKLLNAPTNFKAGLGTQYRDRIFNARFIGAELTTNNPELQTQIRSLPVNQIFSPSLFESGVYRIAEVGGELDSYRANSFINFGYLMLDQKLGDKFRAVYGIRAESYNVKVMSRSKAYVDDYQIDFLPSVNLTYCLTPKANFRASYYRTLARPEFRELSLSSYYDYELLGNITGNPNLKRSLIDNADIRYEIYPASGQLFSVSGFYKHFKNAIESYRYDVLSTPDVSFFNTPNAYAYGLEFEARKNLNFVNTSTFFKNTTAYFNVSVIKSKVINPTDQNYIDKTRPMVGQSPYVINAGLQHSAFANKLNLNLLYNKIGRRIVQASGINFPSTWENPRDVLDFQASYKILRSRGELKLNASDIFNQRNLIYFDYNGDKKYNTGAVNGGDETFSSYRPGTNISLSFNYTF